MVSSGRLPDAVEANSVARDRDKVEPQLVTQFIGAGAKRVYLGGKGMIVQLPDDAAGRDKCFKLAEGHLTAKGIEGEVPVDEGQRFLEFEVAKPAERRRR
jgi:hypothetical protein